ncbi:MAG: RNA polymerase-binding protein DksA [Dokdonella sp.]
MANSKVKPVSRAKAAKAPVRGKTVAHATAHAARKLPPKKKPVVSVAKKAAKPVVKKAAAKPAAKVAAKPIASKPIAKKAVPVKPAKAPVKPAAKPVQVAPKPAPARPVAQPKGATALPPAPKPSTSSSTEQARNFVTTSKPETNTAPKGAKARATPPPPDSGVTMQDGRYALPTTVNIELPNAYKPSSKEEYMSPRQLQYFRNKLSKWRDELVEESRQTIESLRDEVRDVGDEAERATRETENSLELRTRDRYRKLIAKIDKALKRIEEGRYGFCEETDEEIGIDRLEARPIATLSLDAQERWEHRQKQMGD